MGYSFNHKLTSGFYSVPHWPYEQRTLSALPASASVLWHFFYRVLNRVGSPRFSVSERVIHTETGLTPKTIRAARGHLIHRDLIACVTDATRGGPCVYHLINPETNEPFPVERSGTPVYDPGRDQRRKTAFITRQSAPQRAPRVPRTRRETSTDSAPATAIVTAETPRTPTPFEVRPVCKKHGDIHVCLQKDGTTFCGLCRRDPNAPSNAYSKYHRFSRFVPPSRSDVFGT